MSAQHHGTIPDEYSYSRYFYFVITGKTHGRCIICEKDTEWNEATQKYERFCKDPKCKEKYREIFKARMIKRYGKVSLLDDPEQQRKMLAAKKISGKYKFQNGKEIGYCGTYERDFLEMLDKFLKFDGDDIMGPSPHNYYYNYVNANDRANEGNKLYIPDFYIPSLGLEIEIKQNTNTHPKLAKIDKVKETQKDALMASMKKINYIKIVEKDYSEFFDLINLFKTSYNDKEISEASLESLTNYSDNYIPKEKFKLSDYTAIPLNKITMEAYKKEYAELRCLTTFQNPTGEIFLDGDKIVGYYNTQIRDNVIWLQAFTIDPNYQSHRLSPQMLNRAIRKFNITNISVKIKNEVAINLYLSFGFTEYSRNHDILLLWRKDI